MYRYKLAEPEELTFNESFEIEDTIKLYARSTWDGYDIYSREDPRAEHEVTWTPKSPSFAIKPAIGYNTITIKYVEEDIPTNINSNGILKMEFRRSGSVVEAYQQVFTITDGYASATKQFTLPTGYYWQVGDVISAWVVETYTAGTHTDVVNSASYSYTIPQFSPTEPMCTTPSVGDGEITISWEQVSQLPAGWSADSGEWQIEYLEPGETTWHQLDGIITDVTQPFTYTWDRSEWPYLGEWLYGTEIHVHIMIKYTDDEGETRYLGRYIARTVITVRPPVITHEMTSTEQYTEGTVNSTNYGVEAVLYQGTTEEATAEATVASDKTWSMDPPTGWAAGYNDIVRYRAYIINSESEKVYSEEVVKFVDDGFFPTKPGLVNQQIYINDEEVEIGWREEETLPTGWSYVSAVVQGRTVTDAGVVKHTISQSFDPSSGSAIITVTDCPRYTKNDWITLRVQVTYTDGTNTYTIGSQTRKYQIFRVKPPVITHYMTTSEPYTTGTSNSYNYYVRAKYFQGIALKETVEVPVASDGTWSMNPPTSVTPAIGDSIIYQSMWNDGTDILLSDEVQETITE